jgi:ClpP class serine protease
MAPEKYNFSAWLPSGIAAIDSLDTLRALESQIAASPPQTPRASDDLDEWERYCQKKADKRVGLRLYPQLGLAVQPVSGVLMQGASRMWEAFFGVMNTARISRAAATVLALPDIKYFVLDFATPGGYVTGVAEAATALQNIPAVRKDVAVIGFTGSQCCSAGEWIAAGCQLKKAAPSSTNGSIGVFNYLVDSHRMYEEAGYDVILVTDGKYKAMGMPGVKVSDDQKALLKAGVMETSAEFKGYLRTRRPGISDETMQGQTFTAKKAPAGIHDGTEFDNLEELIAAVCGV